MTVGAVDGTGAPVPGAHVIVSGPVDRDAETREDGTIRLLRMRTGAYRVRVEHVRFITLERDVTLRAGQPQTVEMTLSEAPPPPAEPEEPEEPAPPAQDDAPPGEPRSLLVTDFIEKNFIGRDPTREDELGCTASARTRLIQLREALPEQSSADSDEVLYVIAGEGTLRLGNRDVALQSSALAIVPRGTVRAITRKGRNPLIVLSVVSGRACTEK
jgi:mannose-6-phosphate isomerase-like protein (cupin superfamily)